MYNIWICSKDPHKCIGVAFSQTFEQIIQILKKYDTSFVFHLELAEPLLTIEF